MHKSLPRREIVKSLLSFANITSSLSSSPYHRCTSPYDTLHSGHSPTKWFIFVSQPFYSKCKTLDEIKITNNTVIGTKAASQVEDENSSSFLVRRAVATQLSLTINPRNLFHIYAVIYQPRLLLLSAVYFRLEIYLCSTSRISPELEQNYVYARILFFKRDLARIGSAMWRKMASL